MMKMMKMPLLRHSLVALAMMLTIRGLLNTGKSGNLDVGRLKDQLSAKDAEISTLQTELREQRALVMKLQQGQSSSSSNAAGGAVVESEEERSLQKKNNKPRGRKQQQESEKPAPESSMEQEPKPAPLQENKAEVIQKNQTQNILIQAADKVSQNGEQKSLRELELIMHKRRYDQLNNSNVDDMLVWLMSNRTNGTRGMAFLSNFDYFRITGDSGTTGSQSLPTHPKKYKFIYADDARHGICQAAHLFKKYREQPNAEPYPHVLLFSIHEDYGGMKDGATATWQRNGRCKASMVWDYLNHNDTLGAFTFQSHFRDHPKVHSVALGYRFEKHGRNIFKALRMFSPTMPRSKDIMFNNNLGHQASRRTVLKILQDNFKDAPVPIKNTFSKKNLTKYYVELQESKFIASPIGLGRDCYRNYEALFMGSIPIISHEGRTDGWFRTFDDLPVAWIGSWNEVTPQWVEREYRRLLEKGHTYNWRKLTKSWWVEHIYGLFDKHEATKGQQQQAIASE